MEKKELKEEIKKVLEGKSIYEMSPISGLNPMTKEEIIYWIVETYIEQELDKAREEVERKFVEKYHKRGEEMNVPYSEEDGKEFWQGYKEGYNQGLKDMIVDTYYLDKEFELKLKQ
jgi:hypothetical protein